jgi:hypothetical protein
LVTERAKPTDPERICPVCLAPINASDKVRGLGDNMMHEGCEYTRPAAADPLPRPN